MHIQLTNREYNVHKLKQQGGISYNLTVIAIIIFWKKKKKMHLNMLVSSHTKTYDYLIISLVNSCSSA